MVSFLTLASLEAGEHQGVIVELGYTTRFEFGPEVKLQAAAAGALECELASKSIAVPRLSARQSSVPSSAASCGTRNSASTAVPSIPSQRLWH